MSHRILLACGALLLASAPATAQTRKDSTAAPQDAAAAKQAAAKAAPPVKTKNPSEFVKLTLHVSATSGGAVVVDRGAADGLKEKDKVYLIPRDGVFYAGTVVHVQDHLAMIELGDKSATPTVGMKGVVKLPRSRFRGAAAPQASASKPKPDAGKTAAAGGSGSNGSGGATPPPKSSKPSASAQSKPSTSAQAKSQADASRTANGDEDSNASDKSHPPWKNQDKDFTPDKPLLTAFKPLRPDERGVLITGSVFAIGDANHSTEAGGSNSYVRGGTDLSVENLFHDGGILHVNTEVDFRTVETQDDSKRELDLTTRELSYTLGGTRFSPQRFEFGRFLQYGMPEFGYLDGAEWTYRKEGGSRIGASLGFMPEPDADFQSFSDFQVAAYYQWVSDVSERFSITGGAETTFHHGSHDRDLIIAKLHYVPVDGWSANGSVWLDLYGSGDDQKNKRYEVTQAVWTVGRHFHDGDGFDLNYRHLAFPEIDRKGEFTPGTVQQPLFDNHVDRAWISAWMLTEGKKRLHMQAGAWKDEDESGGFGEAGLDWPEILFDDDHTDFTVFGEKAQFTKVTGARVAWSKLASNGHWDAFYEFADHQQDGFTTQFGQSYQHRVYVARSFYTSTGWDITLQAEVSLWDTDNSWSLGFLVQKSF